MDNYIRVPKTLVQNLFSGDGKVHDFHGKMESPQIIHIGCSAYEVYFSVTMLYLTYAEDPVGEMPSRDVYGMLPEMLEVYGKDSLYSWGRRFDREKLKCFDDKTIMFYLNELRAHGSKLAFSDPVQQKEFEECKGIFSGFDGSLVFKRLS